MRDAACYLVSTKKTYFFANYDVHISAVFETFYGTCAECQLFTSGLNCDIPEAFGGLSCQQTAKFPQIRLISAFLAW